MSESNVESRAKLSRGGSNKSIYQMVSTMLSKKYSGGGLLLDIGCGSGSLNPFVRAQVDRYIGVDVVRYEDLSAEIEFIPFDLDSGKVPLADESANIVCSAEVIEHLENPRAFVRELVRLTKPGGLIIITTPNQLSILSKLTLILKNEFNAFQEAPGLYPSHITALLEIDLIRIFKECGLTNIEVDYSNSGRIPFTSMQWPTSLRVRAVSDNVLCIGEKVL
jgi:2-polyprenyl-3-methyl-5-hydroxy-6-metoxy-1,4-benzoquinol methylase